MDTTKMLDGIASAIERAVGQERPATKRMDHEAFAAYALDQIEKAAKDPPECAVRRLRALGGAVETAKQAFVDQASETIQV